MNKKGFTLVELLATIVVLSIVVGLTIVGINANIKNAKKKTEEVFIGTLRDAIKIYLDSDNTNISWGASTCSFEKVGKESNLYKANDSISFGDIISSEYHPIVEKDLINPANEKLCSSDLSVIDIYRDDDYVYYYYIDKDSLHESDGSLSCFLDSDLKYISNLPNGVLNKLNNQECNFN